METFLLCFFFFALAALGMGVGVLTGRQPLMTGGCGGANCDNKIGVGCGACGGDAEHAGHR